MKGFIRLLAVSMLAGLFATGAAHALPALQLGDGANGDWVYDDVSETWVVSSTSFTLNAYANATAADGGNGAYAWDPAAGSQTAYLIVAAAPQTADATDVFNISLSQGTLVTSGWGAPPIEDPNSLASHGIYNTYFEVYEFVFNGSLGLISDQQQGETGSGQGFTESFDVDILALTGITGLHFDLFTVSGDGVYVPGTTLSKDLVKAFAPFSHDAEYAQVVEPATLGLLGMGMLGLAFGRRKK